MAIAVNDSIARWTGTPSSTAAITSGSFTPDNASLLVLCVNGDEFDDSSNKALAVAGGSLTWTERIRRGSTEAGAGIASIWTAPVTIGASMTIDVNRTTAGGEGSGRLSAKVYIVTGQAVSPIGNSNSANWTTNPQTLAVTAAGAGRLFGCGTDWNQTGAPASTDTEDAADYSAQISVMSAYKSADHSSGSQSIQFDPVGTPTGNVVVLEILSLVGGGSNTTITPTVGALALAGLAATVAMTANHVRTPTVGSVALTGNAPTLSVSGDATRTPSVGSVSLTGNAPTVSVSGAVTRIPSVGSLSLTGNAPTVSVSGAIVITPQAGSLALTGIEPLQTLTVQPPTAGSLALTGNAPVVIRGTIIQPSAGSLAFAGNVPTVLTPRAIAPSLGAISLTGLAPTVTVGASNTTITPSTGSLTITGNAATLILSSPRIVPGTGSITLTSNVPIVGGSSGGAGIYRPFSFNWWRH